MDNDRKTISEARRQAEEYAQFHNLLTFNGYRPIIKLDHPNALPRYRWPHPFVNTP